MNLRQFRDQVSPELIEKVKACKTEEEMMEMLKAEKVELSPDMLDAVSGGLRTPEHDGDSC